MRPKTNDRTRMLDGVFDPIARCLTPTVARRMVKLRADPKLRARIQKLAEKCSEGDINAEERDEYETYVRAIHFLTVVQSKARAFLARRSAS